MIQACLPLAPHDFGRITQAGEVLLPEWDLERSTHAERLAAEAAAARDLMLAEAADERQHPTVPEVVPAPAPKPATQPEAKP